MQQSLLNSAASPRHFRNGWILAVIGFHLAGMLLVMVGVSLLGKR